MITLNEFLFLYCLKASTHYGYFELLPWDRKSRIVRDFPSFFCDWKSQYFFISGTGWETLSDDFWGEVSRLLRKWEVPVLGAYFHDPLLFFFHTLITHLTKFLLWFFATLDRPNLEDQYHHRVRAALAYACEIEDFDNLVDPRHLYDCCLGPEPLKYVLEKIRREKKSKFIYPLLCLSQLRLLSNWGLPSSSLIFIFLIFFFTEMAT